MFLDGEPQGASPPLTELRMRAGKHVVEVRHGDDPPLKREFDLKPGERIDLKHVFSPLPQVVFDVTPSGEIVGCSSWFGTSSVGSGPSDSITRPVPSGSIEKIL